MRVQKRDEFQGVRLNVVREPKAPDLGDLGVVLALPARRQYVKAITVTPYVNQQLRSFQLWSRIVELWACRLIQNSS
jgi:hypothetical protein